MTEIFDQKKDDHLFKDIVIRVYTVIDQYLVKPQLLDDIMEEILENLLNSFRKYMKEYIDFYKKNQKLMEIDEKFNSLVQIMYVLIK